ncbi:MAG: sulfatase-like hydrolase/transferase [Gammaproteobacteria bacterium]
MKPLTKLLPRLQLYTIKAVLLFLLVQNLLRIVFWLRFNNPLDPISSSDLWHAFYLGLKYDLQVSLGLGIPILLLGWIRPLHPVNSVSGQRIWTVYCGIVVLGLLAIYATDFGHYAYLEQRLNATALRFLENLQISATMVWQTYPVITGSLILILLVYVSLTLFKFVTRDIEPIPGQYPRWYQKTTIVLITFFVVLFGLYGKASWYPLRWSDAFFSTHAFTGQLATNPILYFFNTLKNKDETFDMPAARDAYPLMTQYLGIEQPDPDTLNFVRSVEFDGAPRRTPPNVVVVILESFASYKAGLAGNPLNPTPNLDRLAEQGHFYPNFYVTQTGTARSVWTFITGIPDVELNKTSSRNPLIVDQYTIINAFDNHKKLYFLGGSASWANIRGLLSANIPELDIYEEGSYSSARVDVWGISDLSLFREAHRVLKAVDGPFFAIIQTSGNHRPYTIPEDNASFEVLGADDLELEVTDYGFNSLEELNSFRFMDHSIGHFIELAAEEPYFDNTLFVFFGDHGIHAQTGKHTPRSEEQLRLSGLRVPLVMYGQGIISQPQVFDKVASQVDVLPTIAAVTQTDYINSALGRNLLDERFDDHRYAFTIEHGGGRVIGLLTDQHYFMMNFDGTDARLHRLDSDTPREDVAAQQPELTRTLAEYTAAMRDTIQYMRENNKPADINRAGQDIQQNQSTKHQGGGI